MCARVECVIHGTVEVVVVEVETEVKIVKVLTRPAPV
jgi:hypothetical protein